MEVEIVAKELIRPSLPTIKTYNLSLLDQQLIGCIYNRAFFFYQNTSGISTEELIIERTQILKSSLSEVLTQYYPLAGKTKDTFSVCIGEADGVEFLEARVHKTLSQFIEKPDINLFLPQLVSDDYWESLTRPLLIIQANFFTCGGLAIGVNISHRVSDGTSFVNFMIAWAKIALTNINNIARPDFSGSLVFPPSDQLLLGAEAMRGIMSTPNFVTKRFLFSEPNIISLQEKATKLGTRAPSRVLTVSAFLWRIAIKMLMSKAGCSQTPSTITMPINVRNFLPPPICDQTFGNLVEGIMVHNQKGDTEISNLVCFLKESFEELRKIYHDKVTQGNRTFTSCLGNTSNSIELALGPKITNNFAISSWCRFPLYNVDFGWGKPIWIANHTRAPNWILLIDTSDGSGIEAWVSLVEDDMVLFASDEELLSYAAVDPSVQ